MKTPHFFIFIGLAAVAIANDIPTPHIPQDEAKLPVQSAPSTPLPQDAKLPPGETRIRAGIVLQGILHDTLAGVRDKDSAEAATGVIMRFSRELQQWAQGFSALPPVDEETRALYEEKYLPIIRRMNERIKAQGERIAAAEFYGSQNLPAALVRLVQSVQ